MGSADASYEVVLGDCRDVVPTLTDDSIDVVVTSPPYWGQRLSAGTGVEDDPREYLDNLCAIFTSLLEKLKDDGIVWINIGDAYNTPINWKADDHTYSTLGAAKNGLAKHNSAYAKNRAKRNAFIDKDVPWLSYGSLLALPHRLIERLTDVGYVFRGEVIWVKKNPMPEGRCRRPHRAHEPIYLFAKTDKHAFRTTPPVKSVWEIASDRIDGLPHYSRYPLELPRRCIEAYGITGPDVLVFDPFSGSGTTGIAAAMSGCSYLGCEIDPDQAAASRERILRAALPPSASPARVSRTQTRGRARTAKRSVDRA